MKQPKKDQTLEAVKAQGKKTEVALKAASLRQEKAITRAVKAGSKETASSVGKMTKSLKGTMNAGLSEIASSIANQPQPLTEEAMIRVMAANQPQPSLTEEALARAIVAGLAAQQPQPAPEQKNNRVLVIGMIVVAIVFAVMGCVITALIMRGNKGSDEVTINARFEQERAALIELVNKKTEESTNNLANVVSQSTNDRLKGVMESQTAIVNEFRLALVADREKADSQMNAITTQLGNLAGVVGRVNSKVDEQAEIAKNNAKQNNQYFDERIAAVMGVVNRLENQTARAETSKQPESVVAAPVSETRNEQSSTSMVGASAGSSKESEEVVLDEKSSWNGSVKLGYRSNGLRENGTTSSDGSVMTADARVSWKNLYVNVGMMKGDNLNDEQNVAVGYELGNFDFSTGFEKRPNGNRLFIGAAMDYPVWNIGRGGLFSIVASGKYLMYTDDLVSSNREITKNGYEIGAGIKHNIGLTKWWDLTSQLGLMHQSGYDQVWRVSPWGKGWPYNIDASTVGYLKVGSKFEITRNIDFNVDLLGTSTLGKSKFVKNGFESSFGVSLDIDVWNMIRRR